MDVKAFTHHMREALEDFEEFWQTEGEDHPQELSDEEEWKEQLLAWLEVR